VLIDEHRIAVRVDQQEPAGANGLLLDAREGQQSLLFDVTLQLAHVGKLRQRARVLIPGD
jgi:hypothetical protein